MSGAICPRCGDTPPLDDPWHRAVGARSRTDNHTMVCNRCGTEEALQDFFSATEGNPGLTPQSEWPVRRGTGTIRTDAEELADRLEQAVLHLNEPEGEE